MLESFFKNKELYSEFLSALESHNGDLQQGRLTNSEIETSIDLCKSQFILLKSDFDKGLEIEVTPFLPRVSKSYKYLRSYVSCRFLFSKSKISKFFFERKKCGINGNVKPYVLFLTNELRSKISRRLFERVKTLPS